MATILYATNNFVGDGTTTIWNINFSDGYIFVTDVKARYVDNTGAYVDIPVTNVSGNVVTISPAVANGQVFSIYRDTQKTEPLVDFSDGAILNETNLDVMAKQAIMVAAEATDLAGVLSVQTNIALANSALALSEVDIAQDAAIASATSAAAAQASASAANSAANTAITTANNALSVANGVDAKATSALANSLTAIDTANAASSTANGIAGTANTALSQSSAAVSTANSAAADAATAISTANSANTTAGNKANKGANNDITSLSGLTTPLSILQGGTGQNTANAALVGLGIPNGTVTGQLLTWNGTAWVNVAPASQVGRLLGITTLINNTVTSFTPNPLTTHFILTLMGAGGAGGSVTTSYASTTTKYGYGNAGQCGSFLKILAPKSNFTIFPIVTNVGLKGSSIQSGAGNGQAGGSSSFGVGDAKVVTALGGAGGLGNQSVTFPARVINPNFSWDSGFPNTIPVGATKIYELPRTGYFEYMFHSATLFSAINSGDTPFGKTRMNSDINSNLNTSGYGTGGIGAIQLPSATTGTNAGSDGNGGIIIIEEWVM